MTSSVKGKQISSLFTEKDWRYASNLAKKGLKVIFREGMSGYERSISRRFTKGFKKKIWTDWSPRRLAVVRASVCECMNQQFQCFEKAVCEQILAKEPINADEILRPHASMKTPEMSMVEKIEQNSEKWMKALFKKINNEKAYTEII